MTGAGTLWRGAAGEPGREGRASGGGGIAPTAMERGSVGAKTPRRAGEDQECDAVEKGDAHDRGLDSAAIADGQRGQRQQVAVSMATTQTQEVAIHS